MAFFWSLVAYVFSGCVVWGLMPDPEHGKSYPAGAFWGVVALWPLIGGVALGVVIRNWIVEKSNAV